jgi:hypothetical protein
LAGVRQAEAAGLLLGLAHCLIVTGMLMHRMITACCGALVVMLLRDGRALMRRATGATEQHGHGRKPLERNRYQEQASQEHTEAGHRGILMTVAELWTRPANR